VREYRKYKVHGFFRGRVLDVFIGRISGKKKPVNNKGDLVIVKPERRLNLEVGDETSLP